MIRILAWSVTQDVEREQVYDFSGQGRIGRTRGDFVSVIELQIHCIGENPAGVVKQLERFCEQAEIIRETGSRYMDNIKDGDQFLPIPPVPENVTKRLQLDIDPKVKPTFDIDPVERRRIEMEKLAKQLEPPKPAKPKTPWGRELDIEKEASSSDDDTPKDPNRGW